MTVTYCDCCGQQIHVIFLVQTEGKAKAELCKACSEDVMAKATKHRDEQIKEIGHGKAK